MTSVALARKWRPKTFDALVGQDHVVRALTHAIDHNRLHHAYLFTGTRGVGKTTVSRILAKALNCTGPDGQGGMTSQPCGVCPSCREIDAGRFVDYIELDAASNRGVEDMTTLLEQAVYKPTAGRFKVYMIDEVHMLSSHAFNAMLKTLEEPPDYVKFVLATTDPQKVPVTVLSRCLQFNLKSLPPALIHTHLQHVLAAEGVPAEDAALRQIARAARGSMRDALSLTDQALAYGGGQVQAEAVQQMLGAVDRGDLLAVLDALARQDGRALLAQADALEARNLSFAAAMEELAVMLQQIAVLQTVPEAADADDADDPQTPALVDLAARLSPELVQLAYTTLLQGRSELSLAPDDRTGFTMTLLRLLAFAPLLPGNVPPGGLALKAAGSRQGTDSAPTVAAPMASAGRQTPVEAITAPTTVGLAAAAPAGKPTASPQPPSLAKPEPAAVYAAASAPASAEPFAAASRSEEIDWPSLVATLPLPPGLARTLALQSELRTADGDDWLLAVPNEQLTRAGALDKLQAALRQALGRPIALRAMVGEVRDSAVLREARAKAQAQQQAEQIIASDELVQGLIRELGARIVPGSVRPAPLASPEPGANRATDRQ